MTRIIYCATNNTNGKKYIGKTEKGLAWRIRAHNKTAREGSLSLFHRAIRKYGITSFDWEILHQAADHENIDTLEKAYIADYGTLYVNKMSTGYNMTKGGDGGAMPQESCDRGAINRQYMWTPERRKAMGDRTRGKKLSAEHKSKISEGLARREDKTVTPETREKLSKARQGFKYSEESKKKISESVKKTMTPERRKRIGDQNKGKPLSDAQKKKMSNTLKGRPIHENTMRGIVAYWEEKHKGASK